jgi:hypothetical protein
MDGGAEIRGSTAARSMAILSLIFPSREKFFTGSDPPVKQLPGGRSRVRIEIIDRGST